jgi:hypothetical protein
MSELIIPGTGKARIYPFKLDGGPHDGCVGEVENAVRVLSVPFDEEYDAQYRLVGYGDHHDGTRVLIYKWTEDKVA